MCSLPELGGVPKREHDDGNLAFETRVLEARTKHSACQILLWLRCWSYRRWHKTMLQFSVSRRI